MGVYPKEIKSACQKEICAPMFTILPFNSCVHQVMINKEHVVPILNRILLSHKMNEIMSFETRTCMDLCVSEVNQAYFCMLSPICGIYKMLISIEAGSSDGYQRLGRVDRRDVLSNS
jgi:hypothetical protein